MIKKVKVISQDTARKVVATSIGVSDDVYVQSLNSGGSAGVSSFNGETGDIIATGGNLYTNPIDNITIEAQFLQIDDEISSLEDDIGDIEEAINDIDLSSYLTIANAETTYSTIATTDDLQDQITSLNSTKANVGDSYTKAEDDTQLGLKADKTTTYTKTENDTQLLLKADLTYVDNKLLSKADKTTTDSRLSALENANDLIYRTRRNNSITTLVLTTTLQTLKFPTVVSGGGTGIIYDNTSGVFSVSKTGYYNIVLKGRCLQTGLLATTFLTLAFVLNGGTANLENFAVTSLTVPQTHSFVVEGVKLTPSDTFVCQASYITSGGVGSGVNLVTNGVNNSQAIMITEV